MRHPTVSDPLLVWDEDSCEFVVAEFEAIDGEGNTKNVWRSRETGTILYGVTHYSLIAPPEKEAQG